MNQNLILQPTDSNFLLAVFAAVCLALAAPLKVAAASPGPLPATGQQRCWDEIANAIECDGTGQDGELRKGAKWPVPRFVDNGDGTVTDRLTGLIWLKDASCADLEGTTDKGRGNPASPSSGGATWATALSAAAALATETCGLTDGSAAGDWRLPNVRELLSLIDYGYSGPALSNAAGTAQWTEGGAFSGVQPAPYWSSSSDAESPVFAWYVSLNSGVVLDVVKTNTYFVWPVKDGL